MLKIKISPKVVGSQLCCESLVYTTQVLNTVPNFLFSLITKDQFPLRQIYWRGAKSDVVNKSESFLLVRDVKQVREGSRRVAKFLQESIFDCF